ncbi:uncharacterized protein LOC133840350 [Drosophila sulfurigaster albostrigata]|uniref:uncharacterized protein LOC133840350 n=1 Tax=Drosophila sulfurigaster albostrigata TaxID=89887 RepID=UPI002D2183C7|nr:uncharacterized protein LOC133840350 [Drosophila sulfurigaster albostrigata]
MSQNSKPVNKYLAEMEKKKDSLHSFAQSNEYLDGLADLSNNVYNHEETDKPLTNLLEAVKITLNTESDSESSSDSNIASGIENNANFLYFNQSFTDQYEVSKPRCATPDFDVFNMDVQKKRSMSAKISEELPVNQINKEVLQKFAFTEIWVKQQCHPRSNSLLQGRFSTNLENYFKPNESVDKLIKKEQQKGVVNKLYVKPHLSSTSASCSFQTALGIQSEKILIEKEQQKCFRNQPSMESRQSTIAASNQNALDVEPYVSPFEDMPEMQKREKLPGEKKYITVPAGFDLTNLVEYKNPNHWHRRKTTRNDTCP